MFKTSLVRLTVVVLALGLLSFGLAGCEEEEKVELLYVEWECALANTNVVKAVLEDLGYDVETTSVSASLMWSGLASGDGDAVTTAWLPGTHGHYLEEHGDNVVEAGVQYEGARIGLVVPAYVDIDCVTEINEHADRFNDEIVGIDPGAGLMSATEEALEVYDLDVTLVEGSDATMTAALKDALDREEWIVVTGWSPHWKFAEWDLKYLEDPEGVFGGEEYIANMARLGLEEDMPEVYAVLENFSWTDDDIGEVMAMNMEGGDPADNARKWVEENQDKVQQWLP